MASERTSRLSVRIAPEEMRMLRELAHVRGLSASDVIRLLIRLDYKSSHAVRAAVNRKVGV